MDMTTELSTVAPLSAGIRQAPSFVHQQMVALTHAPSYRTLLRTSAELMRRGQDGRLALNALRPSADSPHEHIRAMATLLRDEWKLIDTTVTTAYQEELTAVNDLLGRNLRFNITNPFGTTVIESQQVGEMTPAHVNMYAGTPPDNDRVEYTLVGVPVPIISKGFWLDERVLEASRGRGQTLDTTNADAATRVVSEKLEDLLFNGGVSYGGYTLYGYTNHPNRNTGSLTGNWATLANTNPSGIITDVLAMLNAAYADNVTGQFMLYIPFNWFVGLNSDYFTVSGTPAAGAVVASAQTTLQRIMAIPGIAGIRPVRQLTTSVVMVDLNRRTVDVGFGFEPRVIQWESQGGLVNHFRVLSIMTFRIKSDQGGRSGIAHFS